MTDVLDNLKHREIDGVATLGELAAIDEIERLRRSNDLLKREILSADTIVRIGDREMIVPANVKAEIERLEKLVFVPGMMKCAKCKYVGMHMVLRATDGAIGVKADLEPERCPNGCGPLWRVTERDAGNDVCDRLEKALEREKVLETALRGLLPEGWGEDDTMDHMPGIKAARMALQQS